MRALKAALLGSIAVVVPPEAKAFRLADLSVTTGGVASQYGITKIPDGAPTPYNQSTDIPAGAIDYHTGNSGASFATLNDAAEYCIAQDKALKINGDASGISVSTMGIRLPKGIYGYGSKRPQITYTGVALANTTPALFYLWHDDLVARYVEFIGFGDVFDVACGSYDRTNSGLTAFTLITDSSNYGFRRAVPTSQSVGTNGGSGIQIDTTKWPINAVNNPGPAFDVQECYFTNCQQAVFYLSDSLRPGASKFHRNVMNGTYGSVDVHCTILGDLDAYLNTWTGLLASSARGALPDQVNGSSINNHRMHTMFKLGVENPIDKRVGTQIIRILSNSIYDVEDNKNQDTVNCAVFVDVRNARPTTLTGGGNPVTFDCSIQIKYNYIRHLFGLKGQEDAQPVYGKVFSILVSDNWMEDCGSDFVSSGASDGAECTGVLFKEPGGFFPGAPIGAAICIRNNVFKDMPAVNDALANRMLVKASNPTIDWFVVGNKFVQCDYAATGGSGGLIRRTDDEVYLTSGTGYMAANSNIVTLSAAPTRPFYPGMRLRSANTNFNNGSIITNVSTDGTVLTLDRNCTGAVGSAGSLQTISQSSRTDIINNQFWDCLVNDNYLIKFHATASVQVPLITVAGNVIYSSVRYDFTAKRSLINLDNGTTSGLTVTPLNYLVGTANTYKMAYGSGDTGGPYGAMTIPPQPIINDGSGGTQVIERLCNVDGAHLIYQ